MARSIEYMGTQTCTHQHTHTHSLFIFQAQNSGLFTGCTDSYEKESKRQRTITFCPHE